MQHESWHQLVEMVWPEKKDTVDYLRGEKERHDLIGQANRNARGDR